MSGDGFANQILGGVGTLIRKFIKSENYVPGSAGWQVSSNGNAEFNNVTVRGIVDVVGTNGEIKVTPAGANNLSEIDFYVGSNPTPGSLFAFQAANGADLAMSSPASVGHLSAGLQLQEESNLFGDSRCHVDAHILQLNDPTGNSTFCDVQNNFVSQGRGVHASVGSTASFTTAAQAMVLSQFFNFTFKAGRVYRGRFGGRMNQAAGADTLAIFKLLKGTTTAAPVAVDCGGFRCLAGALQPLNIEFFVANATGADIVQTVQPSLQSSSATTVTWDGGGGGAQMPRVFSLEDFCSINEMAAGGYVPL